MREYSDCLNTIFLLTSKAPRVVLDTNLVSVRRIVVRVYFFSLMLPLCLDHFLFLDSSLKIFSSTLLIVYLFRVQLITARDRVSPCSQPWSA
jgi:hypothetical protein